MSTWFKSRADSEILESLKVSLPLVVVQLIESIYSLTDTYFVGGLGREALAGVGVAGYLTWLIGVLIAVFQAPISILVAQLVGAGKRLEASATAGTILLVGVAYSALISAVLYVFVEELVYVQSGASGLMFKYAVDYLRVRILGFTVLAVAMMLDSVIVASGRTKYSMIAHAIGVLLNIALDPILIYGLYGFPRLETAGAALATVVASTVVIPVQLLLLSKLDLLPRFCLKLSIVKQALSLGAPVLAERAVMAFGNNAYAGVISRLGEAAMAAHNIGLRIESVVYMPGFAFMMTASTLVGQRVGRGDLEAARRIGLKVVHLGSAVMAGLGLMIAALGYYLVAPFSPDHDVRVLASTYLLLAGLSELGLGLAMVSSGAIRGGGETRLPFLVNTVSMILARVVPAVVLARVLGVVGPWLAMFVDVYVRGFTLYALFRLRFKKIARKLA
ncbi:MAG: MATE family efflux transporter [Desulfurococcaceae archaeon]